MYSRFATVILLVALSLGLTGCFGFGRKKDPEKASEMRHSKTPVADMEKGFRVRWIAQRSTQLQAAGLSLDEANRKAEAEYVQSYEYTSSAR